MTLAKAMEMAVAPNMAEVQAVAAGEPPILYTPTTKNREALAYSEQAEEVAAVLERAVLVKI